MTPPGFFFTFPLLHLYAFLSIAKWTCVFHCVLQCVFPVMSLVIYLCYFDRTSNSARTTSATSCSPLPRQSTPFKRIHRLMDYGGWKKPKRSTPAQPQPPLQGWGRKNREKVLYFSLVVISMLFINFTESMTVSMCHTFTQFLAVFLSHTISSIPFKKFDL